MSTARTKRSDRSTSAQKSRRLSNMVTRKEISGHKITPPSNPPDSTYQPWYNLTLVVPFKGQTDFTVGSLATSIRQQLDPTRRGMNWYGKQDEIYIVQLRLDSVSCWNLTTGSRMIALSVEDYHDTTSSKGGRDQLCGIIDTGGSGTAPKAGYRLPFSYRQVVLRNDDIEKDIVLAHINVGDTEMGLAHFKILFRFDGPSKIPMIFPDHLSDISLATQRIIKKMPDVTKIPLVGKASLVIPTLVPVLDNSKDTDSDQPSHSCPVADEDSSSYVDQPSTTRCPNMDPSTLDLQLRVQTLENLVSRLGITVNKSDDLNSNDDSYSHCEELVVD